MKLRTARMINHLQVHCTYRPSYAQFNGSNHSQVLEGMRAYHKGKGWNDVGYHFIIFPDGVILSGRNIDAIPAGIAGFNTGGIACAFVGDFNHGADIMRPEQLIAGIYLYSILLRNHKLDSSKCVYHTWKDPGKSCPGSNFLKTGNTKQAFEASFKRLLDQNYNLINSI